MGRIGRISLGLLVFLASLAIAFSLGRCYPLKSHQSEPLTKVDTLLVRDTIRVSEPIYVTRRVLDSVLVPVTDSLTIHDTLYVYLERSQVEWTDSLCSVYASGVRPQIDSVIHYRQHMVVTERVPVRVKTRWGIGVQCGYGAGKDGLSPYVGVGLNYNLLSF